VAAFYVAINAFMLAFAAEPFRWWANFITLPGLVLLALALGLTRAAKETRFVLAWIGAVVLTTGLLLFAHKMGALWPLMIVVPCLGPVVLFALRPGRPVGAGVRRHGRRPRGGGDLARRGVPADP
jgi:hypothetical protein